MKFECCIPHLLNGAILNAFGLSITPGSSKHPAALAVITSMKENMEYIRKSDGPKARRAVML